MIRDKRGNFVTQATVIKGHYESREYEKSKSVSTEIWDGGQIKLLTYYTDDSFHGWGHELYSGKNYITNSNERSYSRNYKQGDKLPPKYTEVAQWLKTQWELEFGQKYPDQRRAWVEPAAVGDAASQIIF